jgi:hypothetical protein
MKTLIPTIAGLVLALTVNPVFGADQAAKALTVTGEVIDLGCYLDSGALGRSHAACGRKCIQAGHPVGLRSKPGKIFVLIGSRDQLNQQIAPFAGKTVTVSGQFASRDGIDAIENAQLVSR